MAWEKNRKRAREAVNAVGGIYGPPGLGYSPFGFGGGQLGTFGEEAWNWISSGARELGKLADTDGNDVLSDEELAAANQTGGAAGAQGTSAPADGGDPGNTSGGDAPSGGDQSGGAQSGEDANDPDGEKPDRSKTKDEKNPMADPPWMEAQREKENRIKFHETAAAKYRQERSKHQWGSAAYIRLGKLADAHEWSAQEISGMSDKDILAGKAGNIMGRAQKVGAFDKSTADTNIGVDMALRPGERTVPSGQVRQDIIAQARRRPGEGQREHRQRLLQIDTSMLPPGHPVKYAQELARAHEQQWHGDGYSHLDVSTNGIWGGYPSNALPGGYFNNPNQR